MNILIVDDNRLDLDLFSKMFQLIDLEVDSALSGEEAIDMFSAQAYDLIMMDFNMDGLNGGEAAAQIRNRPGGEQAKIYLTTADITMKAEDHALDGVLIKPIKRGHILDILAQMEPRS